MLRIGYCNTSLALHSDVDINANCTESRTARSLPTRVSIVKLSTVHP